MDETTTYRRNGSNPAPPNGVAEDMGELMRDIVSLAALQLEVFQDDFGEGLKRMLLPATLLLVAAMVAAGTVPIALIIIAELLVQPVGLSRPVAFSIAALIGLTAAVAMGVIGWSSIRGVARVFAHSREEWTRNKAWIRLAWKRPAQTESQPPQTDRNFPLP